MEADADAHSPSPILSPVESTRCMSEGRTWLFLQVAVVARVESSGIGSEFARA